MTGLAFGDVQVGSTSAAQTVTVTNVSPSSILMSGTGGAPSGAFGMSQNCQATTLASGGSCEMVFTYTPAALGPATGTISGTWNGQAYSIALSGNGVGPKLFIATTGLDFGDVPVGVQSSTLAVAVTNIGLGPVVFDGAGGAPGAPFGASQDCQGHTLAPGESCHFSYTFTPTAGGEV
ncbi:MAG TPA: choice-of-anchor D domain-containing protein, partial [Gemmatimonadaceae bacterium]|nr:choice-of-anchor D domain-containing protein [Gemmatimonadaceae bacterium]